MKLQREFQNRFPHLQGNSVGPQGSVIAGINEAASLPDLKSKKRKKPKGLKKWLKEGHAMTGAQSGSGLSELHVTEQIKLEAEKHLGNGKLKGRGKKRGKKMKPVKRFRDISIDSVDTQPSELHVNDQIKLEAAKQLGTGKFKNQGKEKGKKMRPSKRFRDVHIDNVGSMASDLHVTEQIKLEAAKHLGNGNLNTQGKKKGKKIKPAKRFRDVPIDTVGSLSDLHVTEQIKIEAAKQLGKREPKRKGKKRLPLLQRLRSGKREKKRPARKFVDIPINELGTNQASTVEQRTVRNMPVDSIGVVDSGLPDLFTGKKNKKQKGKKRKKPRKGKKRVPLLQRLRSGKKEKTRPARKFVDISLQDTGINQASTAEQKTVDVPSVQGPTSRSSSTEMVAGLGLIDWSMPFEGIAALNRKRRNVLNSFTHLLQGSSHRSIEAGIKTF